MDLSYVLTEILSIQVVRGELKCRKEKCMRLTALNVTKLLPYLLNLQKANQFTVEPVFRNVGLNDEKHQLAL